MAGLFVIATAGGLLGVLAPELEFRSAIEYVLPGSIRSNGFVASIVHPETADVQEVLGDPSARPKAPFPYTNTWGSCMALTLVFLVAAAWRSRRLRLAAARGPRAGGRPDRLLAQPRALDGDRTVGGRWALMLLVLRRSPAQARRLALAALVGGAVIWASPLGRPGRERVDNQHSNDRRGALLTETVSIGEPGLAARRLRQHP